MSICFFSCLAHPLRDLHDRTPRSFSHIRTLCSNSTKTSNPGVLLPVLDYGHAIVRCSTIAPYILLPVINAELIKYQYILCKNVVIYQTGTVLCSLLFTYKEV